MTESRGKLGREAPEGGRSASSTRASSSSSSNFSSSSSAATVIAACARTSGSFTRHVSSAKVEEERGLHTFPLKMLSPDLAAAAAASAATSAAPVAASAACAQEVHGPFR